MISSLVTSQTPQRIARLAFIGGLALASTGCNWVALLSVSSSGQQGDSFSEAPALSADGRYLAFQSLASNLVANDTGGYADIFVLDTVTGITTRVSTDTAGTEGNHASFDPSLSSDGSIVVFRSLASNLVPGDTNNQGDVFVHDRSTGVTSRVSVDSAGNEANNFSKDAAISEDGRYVAFESRASNLVAGDTAGNSDVFVHDRNTGITSRVSVDSAGNEANGYSYNPAISADGRYVAFNSFASNLVAADLNTDSDIFVHDRDTGITTRVSVDSAGNEADNNSYGSALSSDGRYVAFYTRSSNLVAGITSINNDVFVHDRNTGNTSRVSVDSAGNQGNHDSVVPKISGDGRYVTFTSQASNLVASDTNGVGDIFVHDRNTGTTNRVSVDALGIEAGAQSYHAAVARDGRYVAYTSAADNLVAGDANETTDVFMRAIPELTVTSVIPQNLAIGATTAVTITGSNFLPGAAPFVQDAQKSNVVIVNENTITMDVTIPASTSAGARHIGVNLFGTGPGLLTGSSQACLNCVTFQ